MIIIIKIGMKQQNVIIETVDKPFFDEIFFNSVLRSPENINTSKQQF